VRTHAEAVAVSELDVRAFTVGPVQENCYIVRVARAGDQAPKALIVDPGDEPARLLEAATSLGVQIEAILITHCHFDHIGAVAPVASATGAPVYCPRIEAPVLADIMRWVPPGFGPFDSYQAEHTLAGGERLTLAELDVEVLFTPGHSPGHLTYAIAPSATGGESSPSAGEASQRALFSGDVLFAGSVGRVDLPGGDWATLERSIGQLLRAFPPQTSVYPGHMGITTLARERDTNPFLSELRATVEVAPRPDATAAER
jgi:glyoxylase-like metal-dependent hydrolase (beta-lactamase superfamily II)